MGYSRCKYVNTCTKCDIVVNICTFVKTTSKLLNLATSEPFQYTIAVQYRTVLYCAAHYSTLIIWRQVYTVTVQICMATAQIIKATIQIIKATVQIIMATIQIVMAT